MLRAALFVFVVLAFVVVPAIVAAVIGALRKKRAVRMSPRGRRRS
jgi:hypothetical protein